MACTNVITLITLFCVHLLVEPGELQFNEPHYYADLRSGTLTAEVVRQKGCDGNVTIEYSTM